MAVVAVQLVLVAAMLISWQWCSDHQIVNPLFVSSPTAIWHVLGTYLTSGQTWANTEATLEAVGYSYIIGVSAGIVFGLLLGTTRFFDRVISPFLVPLNSIPRIALAPLFVAWFGLTIQAKIVLAVSVVFFIMVENCRSAVKMVDEDQMTMARVVGLSRAQILRKVILPAAVPTIFAGLRLCVTFSLLGVIASEMIAATNGLGQEIVAYGSEFKVDYVFLILAELVVYALVVSIIFSVIEARLLKWRQ